MFKFALKFLFFIIPILAHTQNYEWKTASHNGYTYKYVTNDPTDSRFYTLANGLTVILSPLFKQPRIQTFIAIQAGSKTDPAIQTGLAHYLEHMLFKGTDKFGSLDWEKEKPYLHQINALYEEYGSTTDTTLRKNIYHKIDSVSNIAARYAIANEYDIIMSNMGAKGTNAFTSFEQTVYQEDIPNNVIDKFLTVQAERFRNPVFRLFHTELEAVYEEKNRTLDNDNRQVIESIFSALFPNNNYGKQTTIGTIEHLKNPSIKAIKSYYETYYVPNNMAIIMSGDFNPDQLIQKIDTSFSYMKSKPIPKYEVKKEFPITTPIVRTIYGPTSAYLMMGYRFPGASEKESRLLDLVGSLLTNGSAGLIDLNLVKNQKLLNAAAFSYSLKDYSVLLIQGTPTKNQSLEEVRNLLLQEINNLQEGNFSESLIKGVINNYKKELIKNKENYASRAYNLMNDFTSGIDWKNDVAYLQKLSTFTKKEIMDFCKKYLSDSNYVIIYKQEGKDTFFKKVEKPTITPIPVNRVAQSPFLKMVDSMKENSIQPQWIDYKKEIVKGKFNNIDVWCVKNKNNNLFKLYYYYNIGEWNNKILPIAASYLSYIGTKNKTAIEFSEAFYQLASSFNIRVDKRETWIYIEGMQENFPKIISLIEDLLKNCIADTTAWNAFRERLKKSRENNKLNKN
ncbi:MAG: insulinase family protein, partial [Chitinophagaceae bacterium]